MPVITEEMIHPELRVRARKLRNTTDFSIGKTKTLQMLCRLLRGRHSRKVRYEQKYIKRSDGSRLRICVYSPFAPSDQVPGLLWMHGGGYSIGIPEQDDHYICRFVLASGAVVVSPDYTVSIKKPYPAALEDCYATLMWLRDNGKFYGMRSDQIFVGGDSAGGGLAAAVSLYARDKREVPIAFQMLLYPMLDDRPTASSTDNDAPVWDSKSNEESWKLYLGELSGTDNIPAYAVPGRAMNYGGLPPTFGFVGGIEPFLDETTAYIDRLRNSGIPTHYQIFEGCFHAFDMMCEDTTVAKQATDFLMDTYKYACEHYYAELFCKNIQTETVE